MKVLFLLTNFPKLSETFILNQITGLIDKGVDVKILARRNSKDSIIHEDVYKYELLKEHTFYFDEISTIRHRMGKTLNNFKGIRLNGLINTAGALKYKSLKIVNLVSSFSNIDNNFDIIHSHFGYTSNYSLKLYDAPCFKGKLITSFYGNDLGKYIKDDTGYYKELINKGDFFLPICNFFKIKLIENGFPEDKINIHKLGIDINKFQFRQKKTNRNKVVLLTVARLIEKKGLEYSIKAVSGLINKHKITEIEYNIIGSGDQLENLKELSKDEGISHHINFKGDKSSNEVIESMKNSDIFIMPSITARDGDIEGTPTVILEAMASGLPVISTYHSGIPEIIEHGRTGLLCEEKNHSELTDNLLLLIKDYEKRTSMTVSARKFIENNHNIHRLNDSLINIYSSILNKSN